MATANNSQKGVEKNLKAATASKKNAKTPKQDVTGGGTTGGENGDSPNNTDGQRFFAEPPVSVDGRVTLDGKFVNADDSQYYDSPYYKLNKNNVLGFRKTADPVFMDLNRVLSENTITKITEAGQISFHAVGDTGATTLSKFDNTENVSDMMVADLKLNNGPSFFYHLGDVVYNFGEEDYYYEQFYEPYRSYNAPIFAIPGNHDGMVFNDTMKSLQAFEENFCTDGPQKAPHAGTLVRTTMDQPGVYFTLDAPFVSIIGLYSNVLDGYPGGVISSMNGKFPNAGDDQLTFLKNELARLKTKRSTDPRAIILAVHHPLFSGDSKNGGSPLMTEDLNTVFKNAGLWPDAILSGHAHHYERFAYTVNNKEIPCIIAGSGGFNMTPIKNPPAHFQFPIPGRNDLIMKEYLPMYGYLDVTVNGKSKTLTITFNSAQTKDVAGKRNADSVTVNW